MPVHDFDILYCALSLLFYLKLMNYIRYWQASGESIKTSVRTKTRLGQIVQEGRFRGGSAPYGYKLVKNGRLGKKNKELYDIEVNPDEVGTIQAIFDLADRFGYGGRQISTELKAKGIINERTGEPFHYSSIQNILQNIMYQGILRSGETRSEIFPELQIISPEQFARVERGQEQRSTAYEAKCAAAWGVDISLLQTGEIPTNRPPRTVPKRNSGRALLSGNVFCGHCGGRIFASTGRKSHHTDPNKISERIPIYKCYNRTQHKGICDGPTTYRAEKIDQVIKDIIQGIFTRAKAIDERDFIKQQVQNTAKEYQQKLAKARGDYGKYSRELVKWEGLMLDSLEGTCVFSPEQIKKRMDSVQQSLASLAEEIEMLQFKADESKAVADEILEQHHRLLSWADMFTNAPPEEQKMIVSYLIKVVTLTRDYGIQIEFNISEAQYLSGMEMG